MLAIFSTMRDTLSRCNFEAKGVYLLKTVKVLAVVLGMLLVGTTGAHAERYEMLLTMQSDIAKRVDELNRTYDAEERREVEISELIVEVVSNSNEFKKSPYLLQSFLIKRHQDKSLTPLYLSIDTRFEDLLAQLNQMRELSLKQQVSILKLKTQTSQLMLDVLIEIEKCQASANC
jgi:glycerophosphoryl diester phosphodiesterase